MNASTEDQVRALVKEEISRLKEGVVAPHHIPDDLPLPGVNEDGSENLGLDSLDALELGMRVDVEYGLDC